METPRFLRPDAVFWYYRAGDARNRKHVSNGTSIVTEKTGPTERLKGKPPTISYEVQLFAGGKWNTELVLTDRQEAEEEALRIFESSRRPLGVRVVREEVDEKTNLITATTVFRRTREDDKSAGDKEDKRQQLKATVTEIRAEKRQSAKTTSAAKSEPAAAAKGSTGKAAAGPGKGGMHWSWLLILFTVLVVAGVLTLLKLHAFFLG